MDHRITANSAGTPAKDRPAGVQHQKRIFISDEALQPEEIGKSWIGSPARPASPEEGLLKPSKTVPPNPNQLSPTK